MEFDMNTIKKEDVELQNRSYELKLKHTTTTVVHGVGTYFTVKFKTGMKEVGFSTSPYAPPTHWAQTVFFFRKDVAMQPVGLASLSIMISYSYYILQFRVHTVIIFLNYRVHLFMDVLLFGITPDIRETWSLELRQNTLEGMSILMN
jgi:hypothetical protein